MMKRLAALLGVLLVLSGCSPAGQADAGHPDGTSVHTMNFGGLNRTYRVYKPAGLPASAPLAVMLHGGFGTGEQAEKSYGWDQMADSAKFIVGFITAMVGQVSNSLGVDRRACTPPASATAG